MKKIVASKQFGKDYKKCMARHLPIALLDDLLTMLSNNTIIPTNYRLHKLEGVYKNCWECHLLPDWLVI